MQSKVNRSYGLIAIVFTCLFMFSFTGDYSEAKVSFPYKKAGLNERQAAAHLLNRFTFGARPGQVDEVVKKGIENWFKEQLSAQDPNAHLVRLLAGYSSLSMSNEQVIKTFRKPAQVLRMAIHDGVIERDQVNKTENKAEYKKLIGAYMKQHGYRQQRELYSELISQKIMRAGYSQNQLQETLTGFWFNHFNVSLTDNDCSRFILAYERDAIRPNALGKFETLLLATAKSPAMLTYLDNFKSTTAESPMQQTGKQPKRKNVQGLNENYAREIMELHTLGVDGGYTQHDVTEAARILTGWTINPVLNDNYKSQERGKKDKTKKSSGDGFVHEGDFLFAANRHDRQEKVVLGERFSANGGYEEGLKLIRMLAQHPSTARFISSKVAVRFVSDNPPKALVDRMARTFTRTDGDIKELLITLVSSPEFWEKEALREKIKTPLELAISSLRGLNGELTDARELYGWITRMGEKMYAYQAPNGYPDNGQYWINTGSLLTRMNFGLALASDRIRGVKIDLSGLNQNREPESLEDALVIYSQHLMPERDLEQTVKRLMPALGDPQFSGKVNQAADQNTPVQQDSIMDNETHVIPAETEQAKKKKREADRRVLNMQSSSDKALAQVVGIVLGSPEFQRK